MLSKRLLCAFASLTTLLAGCSYFRDVRTPKDVIEVRAAQGTRTCLSNSVTVLTQYFRRNSDGTKDTEKIIDCAVETIDLFQTHVRGNDHTKYTSKELIAFIDKFFPDIADDARDTVPVFLRLKSSLLGGNQDFLTQAELLKIRSIILSFKPAAKRLEPFADVYGLNAKGKITETRFEEAMGALEQTVAQLITQLPNETHTGFVAGDIQKLLRSFEGTKVAESFVPLAMSLKQITVKPPAASVAGSEWKAVIRTGMKFYGVYLRYKYFVEQEPVLADANPKHFEKIALTAIDVLRSGIQARGNKPINGIEWAQLIDEIAAKQFLPGKLRPTSAKRLIWPVIVRLLQKGPRAYRPPNKSLEDLIPQARLGLEQLSVLEYDVKDFFAGHRMSVELTKTGTHDSAKIGQAFGDIDLQGASITGIDDSSAVNWAAESMRTILSGASRFLTYDRKDRLLIIPNNQVGSVNRNDLVILNAARVLVQMIVRGYSGHLYPWRDTNGLTEDQTQEFYLDVRSLGVDLDLMDSRVTTAGARSFMEGNLFTSVSDGNTHLSSHEALEFFSTIMSAGRIASELYDRVHEKCRDGGVQKDITDRDMIPAGCFRKYFRENFKTHFSNLPEMTSFVKSMASNQETWQKFIVAIESASRAGGYNDGPLEFGDFRVISTVLHYAESVFISFDRDSNRVLSEDEVEFAFPVFREFLRRLSGVNSEFAQKKIFSFMIRAGRPPADKKELLKWVAADVFISVSADRADVAGIMASLSVHSRDRKLSEISKYLHANQKTIYQSMLKKDEYTARQLMILFQCDPTDIKPMQQLMKDSAFTWIKGIKTSLEFARRVDLSIKLDSSLSRACVPLF